MKSYLSGNPELRLALNEDLVIGKGTTYGSVVLDDCNFHECVRLDEFEAQRTLHFVPPEGEFSVLNYRITADYRPPFKIFPAIEETAPYKIEIICMVRAEIPETQHAANVVIRIPLPRNTVSATCELSSGQVRSFPNEHIPTNISQRHTIQGITCTKIQINIRIIA